MADIVLRDLADETKEKLRQRAASNRRSMNAELRDIVSTALAQPRTASRAEFKQLAADIRPFFCCSKCKVMPMISIRLRDVALYGLEWLGSGDSASLTWDVHAQP